MAIGRRVAAGVLAMAATFGLLAAGAAVARQATVTSPVARAMRLSAVTAYHLDSAAATPALSVQLANGVDLERICRTIEQRLGPVFGETPALWPVGPGQAHLRGLMESVAVPVAQGIATGRYVAMADAVHRLAAAHGVRARVEVDAAAVYVTLIPAGGGGEAYGRFARATAAAPAGSGA